MGKIISGVVATVISTIIIGYVYRTPHDSEHLEVIQRFFSVNNAIGGMLFSGVIVFEPRLPQVRELNQRQAPKNNNLSKDKFVDSASFEKNMNKNSWGGNSASNYNIPFGLNVDENKILQSPGCWMTPTDKDYIIQEITIKNNHQTKLIEPLVEVDGFVCVFVRYGGDVLSIAQREPVPYKIRPSAEFTVMGISYGDVSGEMASGGTVYVSNDNLVVPVRNAVSSDKRLSIIERMVAENVSIVVGVVFMLLSITLYTIISSIKAFVFLIIRRPL